ncbi:MAG: calcium/sodium antiporter [Planctomycetota bacterium]|nr:calcium/sodium antiporter [Planctomycetaceae bacterium]MDQ3329206.1 calcium/sodium antiporter [Planctomycetota bacterium]
MLIPILYLIVGLALLYFGGEGLVRGAAGLALRLGLTPLAVGLTVVAFGTSCPELAVSLNAAIENKGDVSMGNVVGSNIANIGLILGLTALIKPIGVHMQLLRFDVPLLAAVSVAFVLAVHDRSLGRAEGAFLVAGLVAYVLIVLRLARQEGKAVQAEYAEELAADVPPGGKLWMQLLLIVAGLVMLVVGGRLFVDGAVQLARMLEISEAVIGLTIVAIGTSLPELSASLIAAARGHSDIAVGNVVGSNLFNILNILGFTGLIKPITFPGIDGIDFAVMLVFSLALFPLLWTGQRLNRLEGTLLLLAYAAYLGWRGVGGPGAA